MAVGNVGNAAQQLQQLSLVNQQFSGQAVERAKMVKDRMSNAAGAMIESHIANKQQSVKSGDASLKLVGRLIDTTA